MLHEIRMLYYKYVRKHCPIECKTALIDSHGSSDLGSNLYYIAKQILSDKYGKFKLFICVNSYTDLPQNIQLLQQEFPLSRIRLVLRESFTLYHTLAVAKYLFTDVQINQFYVKRPWQIIIQTWHGTPLKKLGYSYAQDVAFTGGQKRTFMMADYILFPNEYTMQNIVNSYRLKNNISGTIILNGYPRNTVLFDTKTARNLRIQMHLECKKVYAYMPTWRGSLSCVETNTEAHLQWLVRVDNMLEANQLLYVKLHRLTPQKIDFSQFKHIRPFPKDLETYKFLALTDCLITDYSSVMFDYLCTRKKIILYTYDKELYLDKQGTYIDMNKLPFPKVNTLEQLIKEMSISKQYDDSEAYTRFCSFDKATATEQLCDRIIFNHFVCHEVFLPPNNKQNILVYGGDLRQTFNTRYFIYFLNKVNKIDANYCVAYKSSDYINDPGRLQAITTSYDLLSLEYYKSFIGNESHWKKIWRSKHYFSNAFKWQFCEKHFDKVIVFPGTPLDIMKLFLFADIKEKIFIYDKNMQRNPKYHSVLKDAKKQGYTIRECHKPL